MRKTVISLASAMFVLVSMFDLHAASLAGVTLPDTEQVGGTKLVLNGLGLRTKFMVKVYVAGHRSVLLSGLRRVNQTK